MLKWTMCQVIVDNRPKKETQGQILEVATYEIYSQSTGEMDSRSSSLWAKLYILFVLYYILISFQ